jgi:hypothetical protein
MCGFYVYCFLHTYAEANELMHGNPDADQIKTAVLIANVVVLCMLATLACFSCSYNLLVSVNLIRQHQAREMARLKTVTGEFNRDDWVGIIPGLDRGGSLYESLFEVAPLAHHEIQTRHSA